MLYLTKDEALELCDSVEINEDFIDNENEEYLLLRDNNPRLLRAYTKLIDIAFN